MTGRKLLLAAGAVCFAAAAPSTFKTPRTMTASKKRKTKSKQTKKRFPRVLNSRHHHTWDN